MISASMAIGVATVALAMVLTPGPNMIYLASRSISQGRRAGLISLAGVGLGFACYLGASTVGLSGLFAAVPDAYMAIKVAGAVYLAWLAWQMIRPGGRSPFETHSLTAHSPRRLFTMGLVTNLLNPKIALMYGALIPQFLRPGDGSTWLQFLQLGTVQIVVAITVNALIVIGAARIARFLQRHPAMMQVQRVGASVALGGFALKVIASRARP